MRASDRHWAETAVALIALLLLSYASVRFTVMQVEMAPPSAAARHGAGLSPEMPGMGMPDMAMAGMGAAPTKAGAGHPHKPISSRPASCPYCAAAGHLPVLTSAGFVRAPSAFTFAAFRVVASHGPRGPPAPQPRARGPPPALLTL